MGTHILSGLKVFGAVSILVFTAFGAMAEDAPDYAQAGKAATSNAAAGDTGKTGDKSHSTGKVHKTSSGDNKPGPGHYATEAEARAHCHGTIVWVDKDHFNHYAGSREYGRQPGSFTCE